MSGEIVDKNSSTYLKNIVFKVFKNTSFEVLVCQKIMPFTL